MADLRTVLQLPDGEIEDMETDEKQEDLDCEEEEDNLQQKNSLITIGSGIMAFSDSLIASPLDITTPEELLTPLARLRDFAVSENIFNRRMIAHDMCNVLQALQNDEADFNIATSCYLRLSEDLEPSVRVELMEQILGVTEIFHNRLLNTAIVPITLRYLTDVNNQVRKTCHSVLIEITRRGYLKVDQFEKEILPVLKDLTMRQQAPDEYRTEAVAVVCQICESFRPEFARKHFLPIFLDSCSDQTIFHVRKVCAGNISAFCDILDEGSINEELLPRFIELCKDSIWGVRKSCAENFPDFAKHTSEEVRMNVLSPIYSNLLSDQSRWVRVSAYESLGPFISTFADSNRASASLSQDVSVYSKAEKESETELVTKDFDSFLYWRDPLPEVHLDDDIEEMDETENEGTEGKETDDDEIHSQVYVNSSSSLEEQKPKIVIVPTGQEESEEDDNQYSPTKDDDSVIQSIEFSAEKDSFSSSEIQEDRIAERDSGMISQFQEKLGITETQERDETEIPQDDSGDAETEKMKEEVKETVESKELEEGDLTEAHKWQYPNLHDYSDTLFDTDCEINYQLFSGHIDINASNYVENGRHDQYSSFDSNSQSTNQQNVIPQPLLDNFLSMTDPSRRQTVDMEIAKHCAFSIPGVAYTLGRNNWHCLKEVYQKLATDVQWKVRRTIASSIHELAKILGEELTATELVPVFNGFLKDLDDVRIGVLRHLADFLQLLNPEVRGIYLYQLTDFLTIDNSRNWRFRSELANQLSSLIDLYSAEDTVKYICPISIRLAVDKVVAVQEEATRLIAAILTKLQDASDGAEGSKMQYFHYFMEKIILNLAQSKKWKERVLFCKLCNLILREMFLPFNIFLQYFAPSLLQMSTDHIVNVRICCARALSYAATTFCDEEEGDKIFSALQSLQKDSDRDVRSLAVY